MAEPVLDAADVGLVLQGVGRRGRAQGMHAQPGAVIDAGGGGPVAHDIAIDGAILQGPHAGAAVAVQRPEQRCGRIGAMTGSIEPGLDQAQGMGMGGNEPQLAALAMHAQVHHALAALKVADLQGAQLGAAQPVIEQHREDGAGRAGP